MASVLYHEGLYKIMNKEIDLDTDTLKIRAVATEDYTVNVSTHTTMSSVTAYSGTTDATVTGDITTAKGILDLADLTPGFSSVTVDGTKDFDAYVLYKFGTNDADSTPIAYIELTTPIRPNGGDINVAWNASGAVSFRKDS